MNMREIEVLSELINYQNFSDAAMSLAYSPSVISKYVSKFENKFGIKLFIRGNRTNELTLTPEGKVLIRNIQRINREYQHMFEIAKQLKGSFENVLRVGSQSRFGNRIERDILATFLLKNPDAELEMLKMSSKDMMKLLYAGKIDALFICIHENTIIENYLSDINEEGELELKPLNIEREMYLGISEKYLPGIETEAKFVTFKDFTFAFPFPKSPDENDSNAVGSFEQLARQNGFNLKTVYFGTHDNLVLKLANEMPIAVTTTNVPAQYEGIKFLRVTDWCSYTTVYFICLKSNRKKMLKNLKKVINRFLKQAGTVE
ncbi:MAG: LysR family transcriptional regulator [Firmicutes bacterium]|nr:LysR family transcriptional regulator [Bacillota bacterium]